MNDIIITPLGTISPYPKDNMNCPSFLIEYKDKKILLDCGNGSTRCLNFPDCLKKLTVIITHYHKDHFGDISSLQYASFVYHNIGLLDERIKILLPKSDFGFSKASIESNQESFSEYIDIEDGFIYYIDDLKITFKDNHSHTIESYMVSIETQTKKIIYTSDVGTTNLPGIIEFSKSSDLLISESSFIKEHNSECTTHLKASDAATIAKLSEVKKLLLTHLWPEEDKSSYLKEARKIFPNTEVAEEQKRLILKED